MTTAAAAVRAGMDRALVAGGVGVDLAAVAAPRGPAMCAGGGMSTTVVLEVPAG
ncbi:MAG TPA: hypothetical protein VFZ79_10955 [Acidimicrobiales bacterium]